MREEVHERVRRPSSGGDCGRRRESQRPLGVAQYRERELLLWLCVLSVFVAVCRKEEATAGQQAEGSSHRSSLARRPVILRVARAQHLDWIAPTLVFFHSHSFGQSLNHLQIILSILLSPTDHFSPFIAFYSNWTNKETGQLSLLAPTECCLLEILRPSAQSTDQKWPYRAGTEAGKFNKNKTHSLITPLWRVVLSFFSGCLRIGFLAIVLLRHTAVIDVTGFRDRNQEERDISCLFQLAVVKKCVSARFLRL